MSNENFINLLSLNYQVCKFYGNGKFNHLNHKNYTLNLENKISTYDHRRIKYISELINLDDRKIVLDATGEGKSAIGLVKGVIRYLKLTPKNLKIILSVDPKNELNDFEYEVDYKAMCNWFNFYNLLQEKKINWPNLEIKYYFLSLVNRPSVERAITTKFLLDNFKRQTLCSFCPSGNFYHNKNQSIIDILSPHVFPMSIDTQTTGKGLDLQYPENDHRFGMPADEVLFTSLFNIVSETNDISDSEIFVTEKSYKPFAWHQIPIFLAPRGHVNILRNLGFDMFDDILDNHNYNNLDSKSMRFEVNNLHFKLFKKYDNVDKLNMLRKELFSRLSENNTLLKKMVEKDFRWNTIK